MDFSGTIDTAGFLSSIMARVVNKRKLCCVPVRGLSAFATRCDQRVRICVVIFTGYAVRTVIYTGMHVLVGHKNRKGIEA